MARIQQYAPWVCLHVTRARACDALLIVTTIPTKDCSATMPLFKKSSSSKIPEVSSEPAFHGGFRDPGSRKAVPNGYGQQQQQQGYGGQRGPAAYGQYPQQQQQPYGQGPPGPAYGGYGGPPGPGGYGMAPPQQSRFADAKAPSKNLGSGYDAMMGTGSKNRNLSYKTQNEDDELEAEYGRATGGYDGGGGSGGQYQSQAYDVAQEPRRERTAEEEEDDEVEAVKQQTRFTKQESLASTRNALRIARETEETASGTLLKLGEQSDKLANTERHLDMSKAHAARADDNTTEINRLNRSIFRPNIAFNKKAKRDADEARILNRHISEREEREAVRAEALRTQNRVDQELGGPGSGRFGGGRFGLDRFGGGGGKKEDPAAAKMAQRSRYQFEATESDDELEDELDQNMDDIGQISAKLNRLGKVGRLCGGWN